MLEPRLAADIQVKAIQRIVEGQGNFATVLYKGDAVSGSILILGRIRSEIPVIFERYPSMEGGSAWQKSGPKSAKDEREVTEWLQKRRQRDPDIWVIELDIATDEQLAVIIGE